ncbi:lipid A biosynthesis lauroyl acyltransferase [Camelimonas abortus]|uniref:Lipid A biosynthesis lauroyl acyltransferase n=1 Tax=Camelimonas abortus TaxID=1017184 RepID=A0ABV7LCD5_9HYPH
MLRRQSFIRRLASRVSGVVMLGLVRAVFGFLRLLGPDRASALGGAVARTVGPLLGVHKVAMRNLRETFPDRPEAELKAIARKAWENLGRTAAEYPHLAEIFDYNYDNPDPHGRIQVRGIEHFIALRDDGKPAILFSAHCANWELPAICAARYGLDLTAVFRAPNDPAVARAVQEIRSQTMGGLEAARPGAAFAMMEALERGGHLGMLIDQHFTRGVVTQFLGRPALTNPVMGKFARRFDCPVHGARVIRLNGARFLIELTPPVEMPRDENGEIDVAGAMQAMTDVVAGWVLEHPEQWLWMHRRWRPQFIREQPKDAPEAGAAV